MTQTWPSLYAGDGLFLSHDLFLFFASHNIVSFSLK